jgi:toxin secretion/phage lysis holin
VKSVQKLLSLSNVMHTDTGVFMMIGATLAPILELIYGKDHTLVVLLLILIIIHDWIMGIAASIKDKTYSSEYGIKGIFRTIYICLYPALGNFVDYVLGTPGFLFHAITFGLCYHYWKSGVANAARAGLDKWIPEHLIKLVESEIQAKAMRAMERQTYIEERMEALSKQLETSKKEEKTNKS